MKVINFLQEAKIELQKVNWPVKQQIVNYTLVVLGFSLVMAIFLGGMDYIFGRLIRDFIIK